MASVRTELETDASRTNLYRALTDLDAYASWNPVIPKMSGEARVGGTVKFRIEIGGLPPLRFTAKVTVADEKNGLAWKGGPPGLFTGHHYFRLEDAGGGRTRIVHGEDFSGVLQPLIVPWFVRRRITAAYAKLNQALAARAKELG